MSGDDILNCSRRLTRTSTATTHGQQVCAAAWVVRRAGDDVATRAAVLDMLGLDPAALRAETHAEVAR